MITDQDMERLAELAGKATPGPWECNEVRTQCGRAFRLGSGEMLEAGMGCCIIYDDYPGNPENERKTNATFIAAANPSTILSLIKRLREAEGRIKALRAFAEKECIAAEIDATADTDSLDRMHGGGRAVAYAKIIARIDLPALMETRE